MRQDITMMTFDAVPRNGKGGLASIEDQALAVRFDAVPRIR
jgi:hypothetical protein